jgi:hypothetical protein
LPGPNIQAVVYCSGGGKDHNGEYSVLDLNESGDIREIFDSGNYLLEGYYDIVRLPNIPTLVLVDNATPWDESSFNFSEAVMPKVEEYFYYCEKKKR